MKKPISVLLALVLMLSVTSIAAAATGKNKTYSGKITYTDGEYDYTYTDDYFSGDGYQYDNDVAIVCSYLAYCAQNSTGTTHETYDSNARAFLTECGYKNIEFNEAYVTKPERDTYGVGIASKETKINGKTYTLLAIVQRGAGYEAEWGSNVKIGTEGDHQGFAEAGDIAYRFLLDYLKRHTEIKGNLKIWTCGHSRGGAATNIMVSKIDRLLSQGGTLRKGVTLKGKDIYCYTLESPLCADAKDAKANAKIYANIHNIIFRGDLVTYVAPSNMGFSRYGIDYYLPAAGDKNFEKYHKACLDKCPDDSNWGLRKQFLGKFQPVTVTPNGTMDNLIQRSNNTSETQYTFLNRAMPTLATALGGRDGFQDLEDGLYELLGTLTYIISSDGTYADVLEDFIRKVQEDAPQIFFHLYYGNTDSVISQLEELLNQSLQDKGGATYNADEVHDLLKGAVKTILPLAQACPDEVATLLCNIYSILLNHFIQYDTGYLYVLPEDYLATHNSATALPLTDVEEGDTYYKAISYTYKNNLMIGCGSQFFPEQDLRKAELAVVLYRLAGMPDVDVSNIKWSDITELNTSLTVRKAIVWAAEQGYVSPASSTRYSKFDSASVRLATSGLTAVLGKDIGATGNTIKTADTISRGELAQLLYDARA